MGRHDHALELYVYKLGDFAKAEEFVFLPLQSQILIGHTVDIASGHIVRTQSPEAFS